MKNKFVLIFISLFLIYGCVGTSSTGVFGTGVTIAMDPRTLGTQIDDSVMDKNLDTGDIIHQKYFLKPDHEFVDDVYDAHIRSETLIEVMKKELIQKSQFKKQVRDGETYHIIHPVLKHIALLNCLKTE